MKFLILDLLEKPHGPFLEESGGMELALSLLIKNKVPLQMKNPEQVSWNGKFLSLDGKTASELLHELSHFILADPKRKSLIDFGLGAGFDSQNSLLSEQSMVVSKKEAEAEEKEASLMGILLEKSFNLNYWETMVYHSWVDIDDDLKSSMEHIGESVEEALKGLMKKGFLETDGRWSKKSHELFFRG